MKSKLIDIIDGKTLETQIVARREELHKKQIKAIETKNNHAMWEALHRSSELCWVLDYLRDTEAE